MDIVVTARQAIVDREWVVPKQSPSPSAATLLHFIPHYSGERHLGWSDGSRPEISRQAARGGTRSGATTHIHDPSEVTTLRLGAPSNLDPYFVRI